MEKQIADMVKALEEAILSGILRGFFEVSRRIDLVDRLRKVPPGRQADSWMVLRVAAPHGISHTKLKAFGTD